MLKESITDAPPTFQHYSHRSTYIAAGGHLSHTVRSAVSRSGVRADPFAWTPAAARWPRRNLARRVQGIAPGIRNDVISVETPRLAAGTYPIEVGLASPSTQKADVALAIRGVGPWYPLGTATITN